MYILSNDELWKMAGIHPVDKIIKWQNLGWIGHTLRKDEQCIEYQAKEWNPLEVIGRKMGRLRESWRTAVETEIK